MTLTKPSCNKTGAWPRLLPLASPPKFQRRQTVLHTQVPRVLSAHSDPSHKGQRLSPFVPIIRNKCSNNSELAFLVLFKRPLTTEFLLALFFFFFLVI